MRAIVLLLCGVLVSGCEATAQDYFRFDDAVTSAGDSHAVSERRSLSNRNVLIAQGLVRDQTGMVSSSHCSEGQELLIPLDTPPRCDELHIESLGTTYRAFLFSKGNNTLVVYHEGHHGCGDNWTFADIFQPDAAYLISRLLDRADVLYFDMPLVATNCGQKIDVGGAIYSGTNHNWFAVLDKPGQSSLAYFFNHIYRALDFFGPTYTTIHMVGRSGGGWATTIYSALDWRITRSVSVAGSLPVEFRGPDIDGRDDLGDWEQYGAYLYKLVSYQELYEAAGGTQEPRRHAQIYNEFDGCCFSGEKGGRAGNDYSKSSREYMTERVKFLVNVGESNHNIPVDMVLAELFDPVTP